MVWVTSHRPQATGSPNAGYAGLDFDELPEMGLALELTESLVFWGGLHHNVKTVRRLIVQLRRRKHAG